MFQTKKELTTAEAIAQRLRMHSIPAYANKKYKTKDGDFMSGDSGQVFVYESHEKSSLAELSFSFQLYTDEIKWTGFYNYYMPVTQNRSTPIEITFPDISKDFKWLMQVYSNTNYNSQGVIALHGEITFLKFMKETGAILHNNGNFEISPSVDVSNCKRMDITRSWL